ncbi:hypothetical protein ACI7RC_15255 [Brevibacillus sp. B_LB10_24]
MSKRTTPDPLNEKGLAVTGLTSSTIADDLHTGENQGESSRRRKQQKKQ